VDAELKRRIAEFQDDMPYRKEPFASRAWGHRLHSLCSYQGKLKPAIAHWMIRRFIPPKGRVLDPLGGVGTVAFEAALSGRKAVSNDKSPFAATVARAKLNPPPLDTALFALDQIRERMERVTLTADDTRAATFGLNARVRDYFHPETLKELLQARKVFAAGPPTDQGEYFVWACLLHVLHGNRPYALSRISHPITPFSPSGPRQYRGVIDRIERKVRLALSDPLPGKFIPGNALEGDFRELPDLLAYEFSGIITSPPFVGMRFDRPNWLRLWFCGWTEKEFLSKSPSFLEREQLRSWDCYREFFEVCKELLSLDGLLILHLGSGGADDMIGRLKTMADPYFTIVGEVVERVEGGERHGLRDKGRTTAHHYLFLRPRVAKQHSRASRRTKETDFVYSSTSGTGAGRSSRRVLIDA
jgi:Putative RNA methylase family UPF0020